MKINHMQRVRLSGVSHMLSAEAVPEVMYEPWFANQHFFQSRSCPNGFGHHREATRPPPAPLYAPYAAQARPEQRRRFPPIQGKTGLVILQAFTV